MAERTIEAVWEMEFYDRLRTEIVRQAVQDLQRAMRKSDRMGFVCKEQTELEEWFLSSWGQLLCCDTGEHIIEKCRETYKRAYSNGKPQLPDEMQKQICAEYHSGVKPGAISKQYGVPYYRIKEMLRRWED